MPENPGSEDKMIYETLEKLASDNLEAIKSGKLRAYAVTHGGKTEFALAKSQGQAALEVCEVAVCTQKQIQEALLNVLLAKQSTSKTGD